MRILITAFAAFLLLFPASAMADSKIAVIDMEKVLRTCEPGQQAMNTLKKRFESMKVELDKEKDALKVMGEELKKQSLVLSQEAKQDKELEFKRRVRDYQDMLQGYQRKIKTEEGNLSKPIITLMGKAVTKFGKANGYTLILDSRNSGLVFHSEAADVTAQIIVEINKASRAKK